MEKYISKILQAIIFLLFLQVSLAENYAIIISSGYGVPDNPMEPDPKSAYWYDVVLAYECLYDSIGYDHDDILVFFGNGDNWDNTLVNNSRYNLSIQHPDWPDIVDHPNHIDSIETIISNFANNIITEDDNLIIWLPRGHGAGNASDSTDDDYSAWMFMIQPDTTTWFFSEEPTVFGDYLILYNVLKFEDINGNKRYNRKKILWSSCRSGHIVHGNKTLLNGGDPLEQDDDKTIVYTSCNWDEQGKRENIKWAEDEEPHSGFNFAIYCTLKEEDPWGGTLNFDPDDNGDGVISMAELWDAIEYEGESLFHLLTWDSSGSSQLHCEAQKADPGQIAEYLYINEYLKLKNATLLLMQGENSRYYRVDRIRAGTNLTIPDNSRIHFVVDTEVRFKPGFHAIKGSFLHARVGEIE